MLVKLLRQSRIRHNAGEIVNVSPSEAEFLLSVGSAVLVTEEVTAAESKPAPKKQTKTKKKKEE